jgi:hypothetical protein
MATQDELYESWAEARTALAVFRALRRANSTHAMQNVFSAHFINDAGAELVFQLLCGDDVELCVRCGVCRHPIDKPDGCEDPACP